MASWVSGSSTGFSSAGIQNVQGISLTPNGLLVPKVIEGVHTCSKKYRDWGKCYPSLGVCGEVSTSNWESEECFMVGKKAFHELSPLKILISRGAEGSYKFTFFRGQPMSLSLNPIIYKEIMVSVSLEN